MNSRNSEDLFRQHINSSITIFTVMFIIFILIKTVYIYTSHERITSIKQTSIVFSLAFATIFFLFSYFTNVSITENKLICGEKNYNIAFYATLSPFILIYSLGVFVITILDGWISCFSNTFGSSILSLTGFTEFAADDRFQRGDSTTTNDNIMIILAQSYVNEQNNRLIMPPGINQPDADMTKHIKKYIYCKDSIGEGIWQYLLGIITLLVSYNSILAENCNAFTVKKDEFRKYLNDKFEKN